MRQHIVILLSAALTLALAGCQNIAKEDQVFQRYYLTTLKHSSSADVLSYIKEGPNELLSQDEKLVASWAQNDKGTVMWFNMVGFDDETLAASRKYCFGANEKARGYRLVPMQKERFDAEVVLDKEVLSEPYASENLKRVAFLKELKNRFSMDSTQLSSNSDVLKKSSMMVMYTLNHVLYVLEKSPDLAARLTDYAGLEFDHMNFNKGRIRMVYDQDVVKVKIKIGTVVKDFDQQPDVIAM